MPDMGLASRLESPPAAEPAVGRPRNWSLFVILLSFAAIWSYSLFASRDAHFLLSYLIPPLLSFNVRSRRVILAVAAASVCSTVGEFLLTRSAATFEAQRMAAVFSVTLQIMVCYLALRQWRVLTEEQHLRARSDAELREVSSSLSALERSRRSLARRNRELALLSDIASFISRAASLPEAVGYALERVSELSRNAAILLTYDAAAERYEFLAQRGWGGAEEAALGATNWAAALSALKVDGTREQVVMARPSASTAHLLSGGRPTVYAVFPILDGDARLGLLLVGGLFGEEDLAFFGALAGQFANAMVRDRLTREARTRAERQLAFERRLMQLLAAHAPVAIAQLSPDLRYAMANPLYLALIRAQVGDPAFEVVGRSWDEVAPHDAQGASWHDEVARFIRDGLPFTAQAQVSRSRGGSLSYWDWTVWPVKDERGVTESVLLLGTEITDRMHARQQLEAALADAWTERNKLEAVIENITDAVFITDVKTGRVVRVNSAATRLLGFGERDELEQELQANPLLMEDAARESGCAEGDWLGAALGGETQSNVYRVWQRRDGTPVHVIVGASPVRGSGGGVTLAVSTAHDVTRLLEIQDELERSNRTKDVFLAMLSHELRTPLTPVLGWVSILRQQAADIEIVTQGLAVIERNARLQAQLVDDLLDLSRVTLGKVELKKRPVDLNEVVHRALETVQASVVEKRLTLALELSPQPLPVYADARRIEQVVWNLLSNAIKFTDADGHITVRTQGNGRSCQLDVTDDGIGIPADVLPSVFAPFRQADSSITRRYGGLGIGLAIAHSLVELHGGRITAESAGEGQGARFSVSLPAHTGHWAPRRTPRPSVPRAQMDGLRVLVVEDALDTRELLGFLLRSCGCEVALAMSVSEGLQLAAAQPPEIIISDIGLPDADGYEFLRRLRAHPQFAHTPVIALTGYAMESDRLRASEAGFNLHLSKPVDPDRLLTALQQWRPAASAVAGK